MIILAYKNRCETMGQCMDRIRKEANILSEIPMTYAGRLDPMADGLVIFLVGEMRFFKDMFLGFEKTYQVTWFFGCITDTYDILGKVTLGKECLLDYDEVKKEMETLYPLGESVTQNFPAFSSRKVSGKPLFLFAKNNETIPQVSHKVTLFSLENISAEEKEVQSVMKAIISDIKKVSGDFRQEEIIRSWQSVTNKLPSIISVFSAELSVSSGFYVRTWVNALGEKVGSGAVTFSITRSIIGVFTLSMLNNQSYRVFTKDDPVIANLL